MNSSLADYYAKRAPEFEQVYEKPERQQDLQQLKHFIERSLAGQRVLEVACGTGYWTEVVARSAESVLAIDINHEVLELARAKPIDARKVTFERGDAFQIAPERGGFTAGLAGFWWSHVLKEELRPFLRQFHQSFAPGALIVFMDNREVAGSSTPVSRVDGNGNTFQRRVLADGSEFEVLKNFPSEAELRQTVEGLAKDVNVQWLEYYWILTYRIWPGSDT